MADSAATEPTGRRFSLIRTLGEGSFGSVYLAEMEGAGGFRRRVALKLLNQSWDPGSDAARRLRDEARLLGRLDHRNIVRVDDLVKLDGRWGLVMEYVSGADMERVFAWAEAAGKGLPPRAVAELGAAVANALDAAWSAPGEAGAPLHVVHRDIKPSNIRLADDGAVKVLDFGVALAAFSGREARTERVRYGSLGYMAPERLLGEPDGAAGDIYALGVVLYELLTAKSYGRAELGIERQAEQVAAARETLVGAIGEGALVTLIEGALAYAPDARPTAADLAAMLRVTADTLPGTDLVGLARDVLPELAAPAPDEMHGRVLQETGSRTSDGAGRVSSATLVVDPSFVGTPPVEPVESPPPKRPVGAILGGLVAVLLLAVAGVWAVGGFDGGSAVTEPARDAPATTRDADPSPAALPTPDGGAAGADAAPRTPADAPDPTPDAARAVAPGTGANDATSATTDAQPAPGTKAGKAGRGPGTPATKGTGAAATTTGTGAAPPTATSTVEPSTGDASGTTPDPPSTSPRLRAAKFTLAGAEGIQVRCGDVSGTGTSSTLLRDFPAGDCVVTVAGQTTRVRLDAPRGVACAVEGGSLECR